jgi:hypothetical protein
MIQSRQSLHKSRREPVPFRLILLAVDLLSAVAVGAIRTHVSFHIGNVVEFGYVAVFLHVGACVFGHCREKVLDDFVWNKRVAEVEFCDVWL